MTLLHVTLLATGAMVGMIATLLAVRTSSRETGKDTRPRDYVTLPVTRRWRFTRDDREGTWSLHLCGLTSAQATMADDSLRLATEDADA